MTSPLSPRRGSEGRNSKTRSPSDRLRSGQELGGSLQHVLLLLCTKYVEAVQGPPPEFRKKLEIIPAIRHVKRGAANTTVENQSPCTSELTPPRARGLHPRVRSR